MEASYGASKEAQSAGNPIRGAGNQDEDIVHASWRHGEPREQGSRSGSCGWITSFLGSTYCAPVPATIRAAKDLRVRAERLVTEQTGPSMSTEPDRRAVRPSSPVPTRVRDGVDGTQPAGMLLSFERPASARPERSRDEKDRDRRCEGRAGVIASPRSLKTAQKPHQPPIDKPAVDNGAALKRGVVLPREISRSRPRVGSNGYHRALHDRMCLARGAGVMLGQITVKIVRAHGGCLGTKSR